MERIDPVRYISNYSSGKMGIALAEEAASRGAEVCLVLGPVSEKPRHPAIQVVPVVTADEMYEACTSRFASMDIAILAAAVADFKPQDPANQKVKRGAGNWSLEMTPNKDIAAALGKMKQKNQLLIGFALETEQAEENARKKLKKKNLDLIILNSLQDKGAGFGTDTNKVSLIGKDNFIATFELKRKREVAADILDQLTRMI